MIRVETPLFFKHEGMTICTKGIRSVHEVKKVSLGTHPNKDSGRIIYEDGTTYEVSLSFVKQLSRCLTLADWEE